MDLFDFHKNLFLFPHHIWQLSAQEMILDNDLGWICENNEYDLTKKLFLLLSNHYLKSFLEKI